MFSVYPSIIEGWGLPITESLSFGKVCVSSNTSAMKEAAGKFSPVCDPADMDRWIEAVSRLIDDKKNLAYYEKIIIRDFVEVTWENTANDVLNSLLD
jgi:glycosyltransferase involved in cell wall biosynthesis